MSGKVLIIASDFPPLAGTNTQRVQSFVRHLPRLGWDPVVITRAVEDMYLIDSSQCGRVAHDIPILRVTDPDVFAWLRRRRGVVVQDIQRAAEAQSGDESDALSTSGRQASTAGIVRSGLRLARTVVMAWRRSFSYLPDVLAPWAKRCAGEGVVLCRAHQKVRIVFASAPTYSCLVAGLELAERRGLPFVADFRDLWVGRPYRQVASRWHDWWDRRMERRVAYGARRIVLASPAWIDHFREFYGEEVAAKCVVITNGYDEALIPEPRFRTPQADRVITFVSTGAMYDAESPAPFLRALGNVLLRRPELRARVRVRLIGYAGSEEHIMRGEISHGGTEALVELIGPQPHETCLLEQRSADVLLLFSGSEHLGTLRGKSFEYLSAGKPILALIPSHGTQAEFLRKAGTAVIVEHGDINHTERAVERMLTHPEALTVMPDWAYIRQFERGVLAGALARTLDDIVRSAP